MVMTDISPVRLSPEKARGAATALHAVRRYLHDHGDLAEILVSVEEDGAVPLALPREAVELLAAVLALLGEGRGVSVVPQDAELTTQQAADLLNVSRPFLIGLLEAGEIGYRLVGRHRRVLAASLLAYKREDDRRRQDAADELTRLGQEMGLI